MLGEGARTDSDALRYLASYTHAIHRVAEHARRGDTPQDNDGISIKLSALHPRYEDAQSQRVLAELVPRVWTLCELAAKAHINLTIDAEEVDRLELSLEVLDALAGRVAQHVPQWTGLGLALQAYQTRALELVSAVTALARQHRVRLMCRLVKGAYWDAEIKRAQELGLPAYPVFTHKHHTDVSYLACAQALLAAPDAIYPQFATHNAATIAAILQMAARTGDAFELQRLHGMGEGVYREVLDNPLLTLPRVCAGGGAPRPVGVPGSPAAGNGANSSFVHQLADASVGSARAAHFAVASGARVGTAAPGRVVWQPCGRAQKQRRTGPDRTRPARTAAGGPAQRTRAACAVCAPERMHEQIPAAFAQAAASLHAWSNTPVAQRAAVLRSAADTLQVQAPRWCAPAGARGVQNLG